MNASDRPPRPHVVVIGAGMAGLATARVLSRAPVTVQLIDTHNYTTFPPLLFQVATCFISPAEVARPVRALLRRGPGGSELALFRKHNGALEDHNVVVHWEQRAGSGHWLVAGLSVARRKRERCPARPRRSLGRYYQLAAFSPWTWTEGPCRWQRLLGEAGRVNRRLSSRRAGRRQRQEGTCTGFCISTCCARETALLLPYGQGWSPGRRASPSARRPAMQQAQRT